MTESEAAAQKRPPRRLLAELYRRELGEILPENFHVVDHERRIYRSGQPTRAEFLELEKHGFRSVINLRCRHSDAELIEELHLCERRLKTYFITQKEMIEALKALRDAEKPVLLHCQNGNDRTGAVAVGFRIVFNHWRLNEALEEFDDPVFGQHRLIYRGLPSRLQKFDWAEIASAVGAVDANLASDSAE